MAQIILPAGDIAPLEFTAGNEYVGTPGKTRIKSPTPLRVTGGNVILRGITFDSNGVRRDGNMAGLRIDNCEMRNARVGVEVNGGAGVTILNCLWDGCSFPTWISDQQDLLVESNEVRNCGYGIKVFGDSTSNKNWIARKNWIHDCPKDFMAFEWQGACDGWAITSNVIERIGFGPLFADNDHSLIISAPMDKAKNGAVYENVVLGQKPRDGGYPGAWINGHPLLLEIGGDATAVRQNIFDGGGKAIAVTDKVGSCSIKLENNLIRNCYHIWSKDAANQVVSLVGTNDATTALPFTADQKRAQAGRYGQTTPPVDPPPVDPPPTTKPVVRVLTPAGIDIRVEVQP